MYLQIWTSAQFFRNTNYYRKTFCDFDSHQCLSQGILLPEKKISETYILGHIEESFLEAPIYLFEKNRIWRNYFPAALYYWVIKMLSPFRFSLWLFNLMFTLLLSIYYKFPAVNPEIYNPFPSLLTCLNQHLNTKKLFLLVFLMCLIIC